MANQQAGIPVSPLQELRDTRRTRATRQTRRTAASTEPPPVETLQSEITVSPIYESPPKSSQDAQPAPPASVEKLEVREVTPEPVIASSPHHLASSAELRSSGISSYHVLSSVERSTNSIERLAPSSSPPQTRMPPPNSFSFATPTVILTDEQYLSRIREHALWKNSPRRDHKISYYLGPLGQRELVFPTPFLPETAQRPSEGLYPADIFDGGDEYVSPPTPPYIKHLQHQRQMQGLVHIWFNPLPDTMGDTELPHYPSDVSMAMPLPSIAKFLSACSQGPPKNIKLSITVPPEPPAMQPTKRKLPGDDSNEQPNAKRSKPTLSTNPIIKIHGKVNKETGRIEGRAYTITGDHLVLDPYKPNMAIYNDVDKDDYFMTYDPTRMGFFYPPQYLLAKKNVARRIAKEAADKAAEEAAAKKAKEAAEKAAAEAAAEAQAALEVRAKAATEAEVKAAAEAKRKADEENARLEEIILKAHAYDELVFDSQVEEDFEEGPQDQFDEQLYEQSQSDEEDHDANEVGAHSRGDSTIQNQDNVALETEIVQQLPTTPDSTWTIGNLARSVSRFVPRLSSFTRSTTQQPVSVSTLYTKQPATVSASTTATGPSQSAIASTSTNTPFPVEGPEHPTLHMYGDLARVLHGTPLYERYGYHRPLPPPVVPLNTEPQNRQATEHANDLRSARRSNGSTLKTRAQKLAEEREKKRKAVLLGAKNLIEEEVERRVQEQLAANFQPGSKRKRASSDPAPTSPGRTYGFRYSDFSTSSESGDEGVVTAPDPTPTRPSKRPRVTPPLSANPGRTFFVPDSHSSDSDEIESPQLPSLPPQRPTPAHATLPPVNWDPVAGQRAKALQFSPAKPTNLRIIDRYSTSSIAPMSPAPGAPVQSPEPAVSVPSPAPLTPAQQSQLIPSSSGQQHPVPDVAAAVITAHELSSIQINFPAAVNYVDAGIVDPVVHSELDKVWGLMDDERVGVFFKAQLASWRSQQQPTTLSALTT